jgi:hypothetical protein
MAIERSVFVGPDDMCGVRPSDCKLIEARQLSREEICTIFEVAPEEVGFPELICTSVSGGGV